MTKICNLDRWHGADTMAKINKQDWNYKNRYQDLGTFTCCNYPSYSVLIDNGDVFMSTGLKNNNRKHNAK